MQNFKQFIDTKAQHLEEKLVMFSQGARYGQVVFLVGGAGSGKGFALANFMQKDLFKIRDVDELKLGFLKLAQIKDKYKDLKHLNLRKPADVFALHNYVKELGIKEKSLDLLLGNATNPQTLPNILFDVTGKSIKDITTNLSLLHSVGYIPKNIHITWVLTNYSVAVTNNANRDRIVPDDIMLQTHEGAATTMTAISKGRVPAGIDGDINVILNNRKNTIYWANASGTPIKNSKDQFIIKDFTRLQIKKAGSKLKVGEMNIQLTTWIKQNAPKTFLTKEFM